jgi:alkylation response protein AidB-like acyl-CoA dehydrogenase
MALDFDLSPEQTILADSARRTFAGVPRPEPADDPKALAEIGGALARQGLIAPLARLASDGDGLGLVEALVLAVEAGRAQLRFPLSEAIAAISVLSAVRPAAAAAVRQASELATAGSGAVEARALADGRVRLFGRTLAPYAASARWLAVATDRGDGPAAALVDLTDPGIAIVAAPAFDLSQALATVELDVTVAAADLVGFDLELILAVLAAGELVGAADHCLARTVEHLKQREQFGRPLGSYQALRHRAADDWMRLEGMRAAAEYAAAAFNLAGPEAGGAPLAPDAFRRAAHIAKACCAEGARAVAESAIQLHGGIGFTWELGLHFPLRRIQRLALAHGAPADHHDALAALLLDGRTND